MRQKKMKWYDSQVPSRPGPAMVTPDNVAARTLTNYGTPESWRGLK
jgi:hypothetical protein